MTLIISKSELQKTQTKKTQTKKTIKRPYSLFKSIVFACMTAVLLTFKVAAAQPDSLQTLSQYLDALAQNDKIIASVAIRQQGKLVYHHQGGFASVNDKIALNKDTKFQVGSITKVYTAVMIMQLVEAGKISLEQPLSDFLPQIKNAKKITIKQLLQHRSGLFNFTNDKRYVLYMEEPQSREQMLKIINSFDVVFEPDEKFEYSNTNYLLLGYIIEDIYQTSYAKVLQNQIVKPLKLSNTYFGDAIDPSQNEAMSYRYQGKWIEATKSDMSIPHAAGAIASTPADVTAFLYALFNDELISSASVELMLNDSAYGLGVMPYPIKGTLGYGHNGGIDGFLSSAIHFPKEQLTVAMTVSGINYSLEAFQMSVLDAAFGERVSIPKFEADAMVDLSQLDLEQYAGLYKTEQLPLDINVFVQQGVIMAQATGQGAFPLTPKSNTKFVFEPAGIEMIFDVKQNTLILNQGGGQFTFQKQSE